MNIKDLLNRKVNLKALLLTGPLEVINNLFNRRTVKGSNNTSYIYDVRTSQPISIRSEKIMSQYEKMYGAGEAMIYFRAL